MADLGTYGSSIYSFFPVKILPEPDDIITFDWMDSIGQFQQRYLKFGTLIATISSGSFRYFDYSAFRCDFFPPYIKVYVYNPDNTTWEFWNPYSDHQDDILSGTGHGKRILISECGLGSCRVDNFLRRDRSFLFTAYL